MEVILTNEVKSLGFEGELVDVAAGYARNYLFPQGLAVRATAANKEQYRLKQEELEVQKKRRLEEAQELADALGTLNLKIAKAASEEGTLYGSVSPSDITEALAEEGYDSVETKQVIMDEAIRELGEHSIRIGLVGNIEAEIAIEIVPA